MSQSPPPDRNRPPSLLDWLGLTDTPNWAVARPLGILVSILLALLFALALAAAFALLAGAFLPGPPPTGGNLGTGGVIVALLGAPFLIWNTVIKQKALGFQKEGHLTDRISKAVEQLGAEKTVKRLDKEGEPFDQTVPNIEVRIGGILSLERIAQDSCAYDKGRDHVRVMEIMCAYVRENAKARDAKVSLRERYENATENTEHHPGLTEQEFAEEHGFSDPYYLQEALSIESLQRWARNLPPPREDIAQAMKVIGRRDAGQLRIEAGWRNAVAPNAKWVFDRPYPPLPDRTDRTALPADEWQIFKAAQDAWKSQMREYPGYRLDLRDTNLQKSDLSKNVLSGALLSGARMEGANLIGARIEGANLSEARMEGAILREARMEGADLSNVRMEGAKLVFTRMEGAYLHEARMERADLSNVRMEGAKLVGAVFKGAALRNVDLTDVSLSPEQIASTFADASVTLPGDVRPGHPDWPPHWPMTELKLLEFYTEWHKWQADPAAYSPPQPGSPDPIHSPDVPPESGPASAP